MPDTNSPFPDAASDGTGAHPNALPTDAAPTHAVRGKDARETSAGCRDNASADIVRSQAMSTANGREVFEKSAASWTKRADMLQRIETGIEARQSGPGPADVELTSEEAAEDEAERR